MLGIAIMLRLKICTKEIYAVGNYLKRTHVEQSSRGYLTFIVSKVILAAILPVPGELIYKSVRFKHRRY